VDVHSAELRLSTRGDADIVEITGEVQRAIEQILG
jgi:thiamine phosphate synthase YjbQ (UPF0047 family)